MIIERFFWQAKNQDEFIALCKSAIERSQHPDGRVFTPVFGAYTEVLLELRFDSRDAAATFWKHWSDSGLDVEFSPKTNALVTSIGHHETWEVLEPVALERGRKYVDWRTTVVHPGRDKQAVQLLAKTRQTFNRYEIVAPLDGPMHTLAIVFEFDSFDAYLQEWEDWVRDTATPEFWHEWKDKITDFGGGTQPWRLR
jgi:hypothetical protein